MLKPRAIWMLAGAGALGLVVSATAQTDRQAAGSEKAAAPVDDAPIIYPRKSRVKSPAAAAVSAEGPAKSAGEVDWGAVDAEMQKAAEAEADFQRQVRAMELTRQLSTAEKEKMRPRDGLRSASARQFQQVSAAEVAETRVPVLAPMMPELLGAMKVAARENAFTAFADMEDGNYVEVIGTRMRVVGGTEETMAMRKQARVDAMPMLASLSAPYEISHHEQGVDLSFSRFNVAYQVSVYCKDPAADPRCAGDEFVTSVADSLAILNRNTGAQP